MTHVSDIPDWCYIEAYGVEAGPCTLSPHCPTPSYLQTCQLSVMLRLQEGRRRMAVRPTPQDLARFRSVSPIAHVDKVSVPLLFILGGKDRRRAPFAPGRFLSRAAGLPELAGAALAHRRATLPAVRRVPMADAHRYIAALRARPGAPEVRVLQFADDTHAVDKAQSDFESWVNVAAWLKRQMIVSPAKPAASP